MNMTYGSSSLYIRYTPISWLTSLLNSCFALTSFLAWKPSLIFPPAKAGNPRSKAWTANNRSFRSHAVNANGIGIERLVGVRIAYQYGLTTNRHRPAIFNIWIGRYDFSGVYADPKSAWFACGLQYLRRVKCNAQRLGLQGDVFGESTSLGKETSG